MTLDLDIGTLIASVVTLIGAWWAMVTIMFNQFEKRQDERFKTLTDTLTSQKAELDDHMRRQDASLAEIRRVESRAMEAIRQVEVDCLQRFQTRVEAHSQHGEILSAIRTLTARIDRVHGLGAGSN